MNLKKETGSAVFYIFLLLFIVIAYLYNNGTLSSIIPKINDAQSAKKNVIELEFKDKAYSEDFSKTFVGGAVTIANFENGEKWSGDYNIDETDYIEGKSGITSVSKNNISNIISLDANLDLSNDNIIKMLVFSPSEDTGNNIGKLNLRFGNKNDGQYFEYSPCTLR